VWFTLVLVTSLFSKDEQGYFYTFGSIISIQVFFELGLLTIVTQFIAHEAAHLHWKNRTELEGEEYHRSRLASIVRLSTKWFLGITVVMLMVLLLVGNYFFCYYNAHLQVGWQTPWVLLSVSTCLMLLLDSALAIVEGLGEVKAVTKFRLIQQVVNLSLLYFFLGNNLKLLSAGFALMIATSITAIFFFKSNYRKVILNIWRIRVTDKVNYRKEVLQFQFRVSVGYICGFLIYSLFNPVLFATQGAVIAGKMGATLTVLNGLTLLSLSWITTKVALYSNYVARKEFQVLNKSFTKNATISVVVFAIGSLVFILVVSFLREYMPSYADRFLDIPPLLIFTANQIVNVIAFAQGYYLRSFKQEPLFIPSMVMAVLSGVSTILSSKYLGIT
jgi:O-antigen/teichoic acid export membrane protein